MSSGTSGQPASAGLMGTCHLDLEIVPTRPRELKFSHILRVLGEIVPMVEAQGRTRPGRLTER